MQDNAQEIPKAALRKLLERTEKSQKAEVLFNGNLFAHQL